ncbi:MAG: Rrf2 family transcriptional regulator [Chloroflexi bacterium]|nr:Rrf2 family transcriptional regulator [Chloroflexota bacterium]
MHIPLKVDYGVRALVDLAQHDGLGSIHSADIARRQSIPEPYLDRLLLTMAKSGLVKSQRGPQGGHVLAKQAVDITLGMVMNALDETSALVGCLEDPALCSMSPACSQRNIWEEVEQAVQTILDRTTIADLVKRVPLPTAVPIPLKVG